jgi:hypothetical protein
MSGFPFRWAPAALLVVSGFGAPAMAITLGSGGDARPVDLTQTFDLAADRAAAAQSYVVTAGGGKFQKMQRVGILNFCTQFMFSKTALGTSAGATRSYARTSEGGIPLDLARMTQVADALYDELESSLRAAGLEVVPYETLAAAPGFQKYSRNFVTEPQEMDVGGKEDRNSLVTGRAVVISAKGRPFSTDCRVQSPSQTGDRIQLSYQLKDVYLLSVNALVDFANAKAKGGVWSGARADLDYGEFIVPGATQYHFTGIMQPLYLNVWLKQAVVAAQSPFAVGAMKRAGMEGSASPDGTRTEVTVASEADVGFDDDLYYSNASSHLKAVNDMFIGVLKAQ